MALPRRNLPRRNLLRVAAAGSAAVLVGTAAASSGRFRVPRWSDDPFTLGVASGDPAPDGVVLWTRLAPDPFAPDGHGGMMNAPVSVDYEVAHDEQFRSVVQRGTAVATRELAHSVHPEVRGLEPDRWYFYRFRAGSVISPVGRTRTAPAALRTGAGAAVRGGVLLQLGGRILRLLPAPGGARRPVRDHPSGRLHLRVRQARQARPRPVRAQTRAARGRVQDPRTPTGTGTRASRPTPTCRPRTRPRRG